jgi:diguanylate cyclase (GGDEF)-like protein
VLLCFILCLVVLVMAYLLYLSSHELSELRKYSATLEADLLQKQIKVEESAQYSLLHQDNVLQNSIDIITNLPSPQIFDDRVKQAYHFSKRLGKDFGILLLDIEGFDAINRELGFENANQLLNEIAKRLHGCIRHVDTVSRLKNDIFIFLLPQLTPPEAAAYVAQRILDKISSPFTIDNKKVIVKASMGIAIFPVDSDNLTTLMEQANNALQQAKLTRDHSYYFASPELQKINDRNMQISRCLNSPNLMEKIVSYCLPQMNILTNQIVGIKILAYIDDPEIGLMTQEDYQKIAERENKMLMILEFLITRVITQYAIWKQQGLNPTRLEISVGSKQLQHKDFVQCISNILKKTDFDPQLLAFEISAEAFVENAISLQESFLKLNTLGIQLSIGVCDLGHLALQKITRLPIRYLKLDKRVIQNLSLYSENEKILKALKDLSVDMGLEMIVEGVDDEKRKNLLKELGFYIMQGNLFGEAKAIQFFMH